MNTDNVHDLYSGIKQSYSGGTHYGFSQLNEADQVAVSRNLIERVYRSLAEKYNTIDFSNIPKSRGQIERMMEYANLRKSIDMLGDIAKESNQDIPEILTLQNALDNIILYSDTFSQGFVRNNATIMMTYNLLVNAIFNATSLLIAVSVDYINQGVSGQTTSVRAILDTKHTRSQNYLLLNTLDKFNLQVKSGNFKTSMLTALRDVGTIQESAISIGLIVTGLIALFKIVPLTKELIYLFFHTRMKLSEAIEIQAEFVQANVESLNERGHSRDSKVYKFQQKIADKLSTLATKIAVKYEKGEHNAQVESSRKLTPDDIVLF